MQAHRMRVDLDGVPKNIRSSISANSAIVVLAKAKNPDPRMCKPGGVTKVEINSTVHQPAVITVKKTVTCLNMRTVHRLNGDTYFTTWPRVRVLLFIVFLFEGEEETTGVGGEFFFLGMEAPEKMDGQTYRRVIGSKHRRAPVGVVGEQTRPLVRRFPAVVGPPIAVIVVWLVSPEGRHFHHFLQLYTYRPLEWMKMVACSELEMGQSPEMRFSEVSMVLGKKEERKYPQSSFQFG